MSNSKESNSFIDSPVAKVAVGVSIFAVGAGLFVASRFKVVPANQFMAKTGFLVNGVHVSRKTIQLRSKLSENLICIHSRINSSVRTSCRRR